MAFHSDCCGTSLSCPWLEAALILALSLAVAAAYNVSSPKPLPWIAEERVLPQADISAVAGEQKAETATPAATPQPPGQASAEPQSVSLEQAYALFTSGKTVFVDARTEKEYGEGHIQGSLNIPHEHWEDYSALFGKLENRPVVTYCSGAECKASVHLADNFTQMGFSPIYVFFGGWPEWQKAGYPMEPAKP